MSGLVTLSAGKLAPLCLLLVCFVLYLFRGIYSETVTALPCNGGTYNILLNCTSKQFASMAACFAIIAYITTGVVSAITACAYLQVLAPNLPLQTCTILLLLFFCLLTNAGISESATFAKYVFVFHIFTLSFLTITGVLFTFFNTSTLLENMSSDFPTVNVAGDDMDGSAFTALFYGFSAAMLGVSGFETSSQFIEEQQPGVFPLTLKNMWMGVVVFNPLLSLISFAALPISTITAKKDTVLAGTASVVGHWIKHSCGFPEHWEIGDSLSIWISLDAFIVLAGAVLTAYVGINGLIRRMAMDRCLPQTLLYKNPYTNTDTVILVGFFCLCVSQVILLDCDVEALGGVYCYAFLSVMVIFALGNMLLKVKRPSLPRHYTVTWAESILGFFGVSVALAGNILGKPELLTYFFVYFIVIGGLVLGMFKRVFILRVLVYFMRRPAPFSADSESLKLLGTESSHTSQPSTSPDEGILAGIIATIRNVRDVPFVFFAKHDDLYIINKAVLYVMRNEQTSKLIIVHCVDNEEGKAASSYKSLQEHVKLIDVLYPKIKISLLMVEGKFGPSMCDWLSEELNIPLNAMFISCPDQDFAMKISQLRGMRIITV